jgi:hypothetical protein
LFYIVNSYIPYVPRNTKNLEWYSDIDSSINLSGNNHLIIGDKWNFTLEIKNAKIEYVYDVHLSDSITNHYYDFWNINQYTPCKLQGIVDSQISIYPTFIIDGIANGKRNFFRYSFRPIIITNFHPIFDTRLGKSNNPKDDPITIPIIRLLNYYGFDCSTLNREVKATNIIGNHLMDSEKEWVSQGDCFISILTQRFENRNIPNWLHTEDALSYVKGRPRFAFKEQNAVIDASYKQYNQEHIIEFNKFNINEIYKHQDKILKFREECYNKRTNNNLRNVGTIALIGFAFVGGTVTLDNLLKIIMKKNGKKSSHKRNKPVSKMRRKQEKA